MAQANVRLSWTSQLARAGGGSIRRIALAKRKPTGVSPKFAVDEKVHVKPGTIDPDFPDVPLGGWSGTIIEIGRRQPRTYLMKLSQETIRSVHPIYRKRCVRDGLDPGEGHREGPSWRGRPEVLCAQARIPNRGQRDGSRNRLVEPWRREIIKKRVPTMGFGSRMGRPRCSATNEPAT